MVSRRNLRLIAILLAGGSVALTVAACRQNGPGTGAVAAASETEFVGNGACVECHEEAFKAHKGSRHDLTLRPATRQSLGDAAPPIGTVPLAGYSIEEQNGQFVLSRQFPEKETLPLDLAFGSGKTGMTYAAFQPDNHLLETRMSYFIPWKIWEVTPGQNRPQEGDTSFGHVYDEKDARVCVGCHVITVPANRIVPTPEFFGVGCEACHGPGKDHIALARAGEKVNHKMEDLGRMRSKDLNDLCGKCHRKADSVAMGSSNADETQRFQAFGLFRSNCRLRNGQILSCLSCHDPHKDASTDHKSYEAVCLSCHATGVAKHTPTESNVGNGKPCPVNAKNDCIQCHMPSRKAFPNFNVPARMVDHFITKPRKDAQR